MSLNGSLGLGITLTTQDLASGRLIVFGNNLQKTHEQAKSASAGISASMKTIGGGLVLAGAGVLAGLGSLSNISGEFSEAIASVGAVSGASAAELVKLHDAAIEAGIATQFSPKQAAVGLGDLAQAGYSAAESIGLLRPVLDLAAGSLGKLSPSGAAGLTAQTLKAFQIPIDGASVAVDKLLQSVNAFALSSEELPLALGTASRGAQAMKQSLDETLISLGLVKNIIPGVERASTGVAVAMERMVNPKTQAQLKSIGVAVADAKGQFRPFLDVLQDMEPALAKMTDQKSAAFLEKAFGAEALGGIQAILTQVRGGIKTTTGETVKGATAIKYLRDQFENAGGTAKKFADALLDTYAGQKKLLKGSLETLAIVAGEPLQKAFRPMVELITGTINRVIAIVQKMPEGTKVAIAKLAIMAGVVLPVVGVMLLAGVAVGGFVAKLIAMKAALGVVAVAALPLTIVLGTIAAGMAAVKVAYDKNIGGMADWVNSTVTQVKLAWDGLVQVFTDGGFSGKVREDLNRAENQGVKEFVIGVYTWVGRLKNFLAGAQAGFTGFIQEARPVIEDFISALSEAGNKLFGTMEGNDPTKTLGKWEKFGEMGRRVGDILGRIGTGAIKVATAVIRMGVAGSEALGPFIDDVKSIARDLGSLHGVMFEIGVEMGLLDASANRSGSFLATMVSGFVAMALGVLGVVRALVGGIAGVLRGAFNIIGGIIEIFTGNFTSGMKRVIYGVISIVVQGVLGVFRMLASLGDAVLGSIPGWNGKMAKAIEGWQGGADEGIRKAIGIETPEQKKAKAIAEAQEFMSVENMPAVASVEATQGTGGEQMASFADAAEALKGVASRPMDVTVPVTLVMPDGEVLASIVAKGQTSSAVRDGTPAMSF